MLLVSCKYVEACMNYIMVKTACRKTTYFWCYKPKSAQNGWLRDFLGYILKCSDQRFMVFWIEYGGYVGLVLLKTTYIQKFSFQSYSMDKRPKNHFFQTFQSISLTIIIPLSKIGGSISNFHLLLSLFKVILESQVLFRTWHFRRKTCFKYVASFYFMKLIKVLVRCPLNVTTILKASWLVWELVVGGGVDTY